MPVQELHSFSGSYRIREAEAAGVKPREHSFFCEHLSVKIVMISYDAKFAITLFQFVMTTPAPEGTPLRRISNQIQKNNLPVRHSSKRP